MTQQPENALPMGDRYIQDLSFGAQLADDGTTRFRLWAPSAAAVTLEVDGTPTPMAAETDGWFTTTRPACPGAPYVFRLPDGTAVPDPAARLQAGDVHDPSAVVDPRAYRWSNLGWMGRPWHEAVIYELHVGACGGFDGVRQRLAALKQLGVTVVELMPIADFPGAHNWGYDGVLPFAPDTAYGTPEALKALVDTAHGLGLMVMLDVVYNHFGPDGNFLHAYAEGFFRDDVKTPWGASIDFRRPQVQQYFIQNALYWINEFQFDGLRFDAVHAISPPEFLDQMAHAIRDGVASGRHVHLVLEHEGNAARHLRQPDAAGFDAQWTDDMHHCLHVLLTGESEGYYEDFQNPATLLVRCLTEGFAYQGEVSPHSGKPRGEPSAHLPSTAFVVCLQNHDQIGNRAMGDRLTTLADPQALQAATALLLCCPMIPLLFMGEESASTTPFLFFTDHNDELADLVRTGRREEFKHFDAFKDPAKRDRIPDPNARSTFEASIPVPGASDAVTALLAFRAAHVTPGIPGCRSEGASVLADKAVTAQWRLGNGASLRIWMNLGTEAIEVAPPSPLGAVCTGGVGRAEDLSRGILPGRTTIVSVGA